MPRCFGSQGKQKTSLRAIHYYDMRYPKPKVPLQADSQTICDNFQILTKCPEKLPDWNMPDNCWIGITIDRQFRTAWIRYLHQYNAPVKHISFEPLLEHIEVDLSGIDNYWRRDNLHLAHTLLCTA